MAKKATTITIDQELLDHIDDLCNINYRTRSAMIELLLRQAVDALEDQKDGTVRNTDV